MTDRTYSWTAGRVRKQLTLRAWGTPWRALRDAVHFFCGRTPWWKTLPVSFELRSRGGGGMCYCPTGSTTDLRVEVFGAGFWLWVTRDWTRHPCWCDVVIWRYFGDEAEVEAAGGWDELERRFPDLRDMPRGEVA